MFFLKKTIEIDDRHNSPANQGRGIESDRDFSTMKCLRLNGRGAYHTPAMEIVYFDRLDIGWVVDRRALLAMLRYEADTAGARFKQLQKNREFKNQGG